MDRNYPFVITGIGYALAPDLPADDNKPVAEEFVQKYKDSQAEVTLLLEKDNHADNIAIGVYLHTIRIGYVGIENTDVRRLLDDEDHEGVAFAVIDGQNSRHTLIAHIIDPESVNFRMHMMRRINDKPYGGNLWISFTEEERARDALFVEIAGSRCNNLSSEQWYNLISDYCKRGYINICSEEFFIMNALLQKFREFPEPDNFIHDSLDLLETMNTNYYDLGLRADILRSAYQKVKSKYGREFVRQFEEWHFGELVSYHLDEARRTQLDLKHWLLTFPGGAFSGYPWDWTRIVTYISNHKFCRRDVYDIFEVMILIDWLSELPSHVKLEPSLNNSFHEKLRSPEAIACFKILYKHNFLDMNFMPSSNLSKREIAIVASSICRRLGYSNNWNLFEKLWNLNNLAISYSQTTMTPKYEALENKIDGILKNLILS